MGQTSSAAQTKGTKAAAPSAASSPTCRNRVLVAPYTPPRDVMVWNRDEQRWLRVDLGDELEPTVEWLRGVIARQQGLEGRAMHMFVGSDMRISSHDLERPIDYFTFGK